MSTALRQTVPPACSLCLIGQAREALKKVDIQLFRTLSNDKWPVRIFYWHKKGIWKRNTRNGTGTQTSILGWLVAASERSRQRQANREISLQEQTDSY